MGWSFLRGHYCDAEHVRAGLCPTCGTTWRWNHSAWDLAKKGLRGVDVRDDTGNRPPLF